MAKLTRSDLETWAAYRDREKAMVEAMRQEWFDRAHDAGLSQYQMEHALGAPRATLTKLSKASTRDVNRTLGTPRKIDLDRLRELAPLPVSMREAAREFGCHFVSVAQACKVNGIEWTPKSTFAENIRRATA